MRRTRQRIKTTAMPWLEESQGSSSNALLLQVVQAIRMWMVMAMRKQSPAHP
jgi:hypothetical protein